MISEVEKIIKERNYLAHMMCGILVCKVKGAGIGFELGADILEKVVDRSSVLYLSGGSTPRDFYKMLVEREKIRPGAAAMVDERYKENKFHKNSNELMMRETDILRYFELRGVPFYGILKGGLGRGETAREYDEKLWILQSSFRKHIGILGIGEDGHTAGIPAEFSIFPAKRDPASQDNFQFSNDVYESRDLVINYDDGGKKYGERVSMSFLGLEMLDLLLVFVFGEKKRKALRMVFEEGGEEEVPGRFYKRKGIAEKTVIITDVI